MSGAPERTPHFVKSLKPVTVKCGDIIKMDAIIEGVPKPKIYWFHEKRKIRDSRYVNVNEEEIEDETTGERQVKSTLQIDNATQYDAGKYTIRAINRSGVKSSSVNLVIKGEPYYYYFKNVQSINTNADKLMILIQMMRLLF